MSAGVSEVSESQGSGFSAQAEGGWLIHLSESLKKALHILCEVLWDVRSSGLPHLWEDCPRGPCGPGFLPFSQEHHRPSRLLFRGPQPASVEQVLSASDENARCLLGEHEVAAPGCQFLACGVAWMLLHPCGCRGHMLAGGEAGRRCCQSGFHQPWTRKPCCRPWWGGLGRGPGAQRWGRSNRCSGLVGVLSRTVRTVDCARRQVSSGPWNCTLEVFRPISGALSMLPAPHGEHMTLST